VAWLALAIAAWTLSLSFQWILRLVIISAVRLTHARWIFFTLYPILRQTMNTALSALTGPIYPIAITLFYYDQRIRHEAYDIEWMMQRAGLVVPAPAQQETHPLPVLEQSPQPPTAPPEGSL